MSGHSKWSNIKRKKEINDKQKSTAFAKLARLISMSVVDGGGIGDPQNNVRLRMAIDKAKSYNMPKDNIVRAIERGSGQGGPHIREVIYEAFGPASVGLIITALTDNPNRTASEIRNILDKHAAKLGAQGAVSHLFEKASVISLPTNAMNEEAALTFAAEHGATDFAKREDHYLAYFPYSFFGKLHMHLPHPDAQIEIVYKPQSVIVLDDTKGKMLTTLVYDLEESDDVQEVFHNGN